MSSLLTRYGWFSIGLALSSAGSHTACGEPRGLRADDILDITWAASVDVSPDGRRVVYELRHPLPEDSDDAPSTIVIADTRGGGREPVQIVGHRYARGPRWSPHGDQLAFLSSGDEPGADRQLFVVDADGASPRRLTDDAGGVLSFRWAPHARAIAISRFPSRDAGEESPPFAVVVDSDPQRAQLEVVEVESGERRRVGCAEMHVTQYAWSPDGKWLAVSQAPSSDFDAVFAQRELVVVSSAGTAEPRTLCDRVAGAFNLAWSPDGDTIAYSAVSPLGFSRRLALMPAAGGEPRYPLADYAGMPLDRIQWSADASRLWIQCLAKERCRLVELEVATGSYEERSLGVHNFWSFSASADGGTVALTAEIPSRPPDVVVVVDGEPVKLTDLNPQFSDFRLGEVRDFAWTSSRDGRPLHGVLVLPPDFEPGTCRPMVVQLHGGPHMGWWNGWIGTWASWGQYLASNGYVVFLPNHRGSIGQGLDFVEAHFGEWGRGDYQDVMDGVDALVKAGIADPERMGVGGGSFGGYLTTWTTTRTDRFRAAVAISAITDLYSWNLTSDATVPLRAYLGGNELEKRELYLDRSPLSHLHACRTPTLVLHGAEDRRVPLSQGRAWYQGLKLLGVETEMVIYPQTGHTFRDRASQRDQLRRVRDWFDRHLLK